MIAFRQRFFCESNPTHRKNNDFGGKYTKLTTKLNSESSETNWKSIQDHTFANSKTVGNSRFMWHKPGRNHIWLPGKTRPPYTRLDPYSSKSNGIFELSRFAHSISVPTYASWSHSNCYIPQVQWNWIFFANAGPWREFYCKLQRKWISSASERTPALCWNRTHGAWSRKWCQNCRFEINMNRANLSNNFANAHFCLLKFS